MKGRDGAIHRVVIFSTAAERREKTMTQGNVELASDKKRL